MFDAWADSHGDRTGPVADATWASFRSNMWDGEFVLTVSRDDVAGIDTPLLVAMGNDLYHPESTSRDVAALARNATLVESWKDDDDLVQFDVTARAFLTAHTS